MENVKKDYEIKIETESPIHIGTGESYSSKECILTSKYNINCFKRLDLIKFYSKLSDQILKDKFLDELINEEFNLKKFGKNNLGLKKTKDFDEFVRYSGYRNHDKNDLDIDESIKSLNELYIPGSSLKGAIRTALLFHSITDEDNQKFVSWNEKNQQNFLRENDFNYFLKSLLSDENGNAQSDLLRFLMISDSNTFKYPNVFLVRQMRARYDKEKNFKEIKVGVPTSVETIYLNNSETKYLSSKMVIKYNKNLINMDELNIKSIDDFLDIGSIKKSIFDFSNAIIKSELKYAEMSKLKDSEKSDLDEIIDFYNDLKKKNDEKNPYLRIGAGSGLLGTTVALKIKEYDEKIYKELFDKNDGTIYPKSRRMILSNENKIDKSKPLGWVRLSFNKLDGSL